MRSTLHSLVLVPICAILFISCSKKQKIISRSVPEINYTLGASEEPEVFPQVNNYASLQKDYTLKETMEKYSPKEQEFIIEPTLSSAIKCKSGTVIKFEPDIFIYADSRLPVSEEIEIKVTEYLSDADILFKGLTTMCKNELIETAGMLYVTATANGKLCGIKNGEVYNIEIPSVSEKENMELFYGEATADGINWVNASKAKFMGSEGINLFDRINYVWQKKGPTMFEGGIGALYEYLHANYVFPNGFENVELKGTSYLNFTINYEGELTDIFTPVEYKTYANSQLIHSLQKKSGLEC